MAEIIVKLLEWRFWDLKHEYGRGSWDANTPWETYSIYDVSERYPTDNRYYCPKVSDQFETLELAQAAALRDHESRVRSSIDLEAHKAEIAAKDAEIERLRDALRKVEDYLKYNTVVSEEPELERIFDTAFPRAALNGGSDAP